MKRLRPFLPLLALLALVTCRNDDIERPDVLRHFSLDQARAAYDSALQRTTRAEMEPGVLYAGEIELFWDEAQFSENDCASSFDVRIRAERYYETVEEEEIAEICLFPKVVVVNDKQDAERTSAYVAFYFPDHAEQLLDEYVGDDYLNSLPKLNYSGRIVYTDLQGYPVAAAHYLDGWQTDRVFLYDARDSLSLMEFVDRYNRMVEDIRIRPFDAGTRATADGKECNCPGVYRNIVIDDVVVYAKKLEPFNPIKHPEFGGYDQIIRTETDPTQGSSGGGSSGNGTTSQGTYANNPKIKTDSQEVQRMLDSIYMDCMGKTLIDNLKDSVIIQTIDVPGNKNSCDPHKEEGVSKILFGDIHDKQRTYVLLEELIHSYQYQDETLEQANPHKLNYEIEAKVGWLLYEKRKYGVNFLNAEEYDNGLGVGGTFIFESLSNTVLSNSTYIIDVDFVYNEAIKNLRQIKSYSNEDKYPEDANYRNLKHIVELSKNCIDI